MKNIRSAVFSLVFLSFIPALVLADDKYPEILQSIEESNSSLLLYYVGQSCDSEGREVALSTLRRALSDTGKGIDEVRYGYDGMTVFHHVASGFSPDVKCPSEDLADLFVKAAGDKAYEMICLPDKYRRTALHLAAGWGHIKIIPPFLKSVSSSKKAHDLIDGIKDFENKTAYDIRKNEEIGKLLNAYLAIWKDIDFVSKEIEAEKKL
jgi:hypothetical protein